MHFGPQEDTLLHVLAPKRAVQHPVGFLKLLWMHFGAQEGTSPDFLAPKRAVQQAFGPEKGR